MTTKNKNPRAELASPIFVSDMIVNSIPQIGQGLTIRDWFAGMALQGELASAQELKPYEPSIKGLVRYAYAIADAMINKRDK